MQPPTESLSMALFCRLKDISSLSYPYLLLLLLLPTKSRPHLQKEEAEDQEEKCPSGQESMESFLKSVQPHSFSTRFVDCCIPVLLCSVEGTLSTTDQDDIDRFAAYTMPRFESIYVRNDDSMC
jgi:hypothetical protein